MARIYYTYILSCIYLLKKLKKLQLFCLIKVLKNSLFVLYDIFIIANFLQCKKNYFCLFIRVVGFSQTFKRSAFRNGKYLKKSSRTVDFCFCLKRESFKQTLLLTGTGKSFVGAHLAHYFHLCNKQSQSEPKKILYCGPSNKSVDVVAGTCKILFTFFKRINENLIIIPLLLWSVNKYFV